MLKDCKPPQFPGAELNYRSEPPRPFCIFSPRLGLDIQNARFNTTPTPPELPFLKFKENHSPPFTLKISGF